MSDRDIGLCFDVPIRNEWSNVEKMRQGVLSSLAAILQDADACHAIGTVIGELLENAIKYGHFPDGEQAYLRFSLSGTIGRLQVTVENPIQPGSPNVDALNRTLKWLSGFPSPAEAYQARMFELAMSGGSESRLGLARVAYEGNCSLSAEVDGNVLRVVGTIAQN